MAELEAGDFVKVVEDFISFDSEQIKKGTVWELEEYFYDTDELKHFWYARELNGYRSGFVLDADKIEKLEDNIPFPVKVMVRSEVTTTIYASNYQEALDKAKGARHDIFDGYTELFSEVVHAEIADF